MRPLPGPAQPEAQPLPAPTQTKGWSSVSIPVRLPEASREPEEGRDGRQPHEMPLCPSPSVSPTYRSGQRVWSWAGSAWPAAAESMCCGGASETITRAQYFRWRSRVQGRWWRDEDRTCVLAPGPLWASACSCSPLSAGRGPAHPGSCASGLGSSLRALDVRLTSHFQDQIPSATISPDSSHAPGDDAEKG